MKDHQIKRTWIVTTQECCDTCLGLTDVKELVPRQRYVYGQGYVKMAHSCQACFDKAVEEKEVLRRAESDARRSWEDVS